MKNERGAMQLLTGLIIIIVLGLILFAILLMNKIKVGGNETNTNNVNTNQATNLNEITTNQTINSNEITTNQTGNTNTVENPEIKINSNDDFSLSFLKMENNKKNMIYSPLSIKYALKMLQDGAKENSYTQIENVIGKINTSTYKNIEKRLSLANSFFIKDTNYPNVKQEYINTLKTKYFADVVQDKFESANNVNKWIENKTFNIIKNMLDDQLVQGSNLLLINALAIDMEWQNRFETESTRGRVFHLADGSEMEATTMSNKVSSEYTSYYTDNSVKAISMDLQKYDDTQMEFLAIMPENDIEGYIKDLTVDKIEDIASKMKLASATDAGVIVRIPKFSFDYGLKLKEDLQSMGITDVFNPSLANLSNMIDIEKSGTSMYVSDALHRANIDFTEAGVKAAAVTVFAMKATAMFEEKKPIEIDINKPFVFVIRDKKTKEIWFVGTVYNPNSWEKDKDLYKDKTGF